MKTISKILMVLASTMLIGQFTSFADNNDSVHLKKRLDKKNDAGIYTITLETYVSGTSTTTVTEQADPVDLVLVLDVSGSMSGSVDVLGSRVNSGNPLDTGTTYYIYITGSDGVKTRYYFKRFREGNSNNRKYYWCYGNTKSFTRDQAVGTLSTSSDWRVSSTNEIYTVGSESKISILRTAAEGFIDEVAGKNVDGVVNRIGIVTFSPNSNVDSNDQYKYNGYGARTASGLVDATTANLKTIVKGLTASGATLTDGAFAAAKKIFDADDTDNKKVLVFFTDGEPAYQSWDDKRTYSTNTINIAKELKASDVTVYSIGVFDKTTTNYTNGKINDFMNKVSSNYDQNGTLVPENNRKDSDGNVINYYQESDGSDLAAIFNSIASASVPENPVKQLNTESSAVIDIVSTNFSIPSGASNLQVKFKALTGSEPEITKTNPTDDEIAAHEAANWTEFTTKAGFASAKYDFDPTVITPSIDYETSTVTVPGFNFGKADVQNEQTGAIITMGHWVGNRTINGVNTPGGIKMIVSFDVKLDPEYEGGFDVPSNTAQSGLYLQDSEGEYTINVGYYGVPTEDFPAICIIKKGLDENESAIFTATQQDGRLYRVPLIQKINNGAKLPCYAIVKGLDGNKTVSVEEQSWSWLYTKEDSKTQKLISLQAANASKEDILKTGDNVSFSTGVGNTNVVIARKKTYTAADGTVVTFAVLARESRDGVWTPLPDKGDTEGIRQYSGAVVLLFEFTNTKNTSGKPARSEAYVHNVFKGGTNQSNEGAEAGGNEEEGLESGGNEEEGI